MSRTQIRFRASVYLDIFIDPVKEKADSEEEDQIKTLEEARQEAKENIDRLIDAMSRPGDHDCDGLRDIKYSNPYTGGVAHYNPNNLLHPLDRDI